MRVFAGFESPDLTCFGSGFPWAFKVRRGAYGQWHESMTNALSQTGAQGKGSPVAWPCQPPAFFRALRPREAKSPVRVYVRLCKPTQRFPNRRNRKNSCKGVLIFGEGIFYGMALISNDYKKYLEFTKKCTAILAK